MKTDPPKILIVDDEPYNLDLLEQELNDRGYECILASDGIDAIDKLNNFGSAPSFPGIILTDVRMPRLDGIALMNAVYELDPDLPVILITAHGDVTMAVDAMKAGAYDFLEKPFEINRFFDVVSRAIEKRSLVIENRTLKNKLSSDHGIDSLLVGQSSSMINLKKQILALAPLDTDLIINGETGAGKELVARAVHQFGDKSNGPFVAINCGAVPSDIIESELFGHEAGSFTGASRQRIGKIEHANGGIVFLDEIESMPLKIQIKLLRTIEERSIERVGSNELKNLDVRFLAASKVDLEQEASKGNFRADLFYRLNVFSLDIPPLRERKDDIPLLFHHLLDKSEKRYKVKPREVPSGLINTLMAYDWPGNVRELRNAIDRFVFGFDNVIPDQNINSFEENEEKSLQEKVNDFEKYLITTELAKQNGRVNETITNLKISRRTLYTKLSKYNLDRYKFDIE